MSNEIVAQWIRERAAELAPLIPVELCPSHEDGDETSWGQDGHPWASGPHQILTICIPWMQNCDEMIRCLHESQNGFFGLCVRPIAHPGHHFDSAGRTWEH